MFVHRPLTVQSSFVVHLHQHPSTPSTPSHPSNQQSTTSSHSFNTHQSTINHQHPIHPQPGVQKERASEWATRVTRNGTVTTVLAYHLPLPPSYIPKPHASTIPVSYTHIHHPTLESIKQLHSIITNVNHHQPSSINQQPSFVQHSPINYQPSFISIQFTRNLVCKRDAQQLQLLVGEIYVHSCLLTFSAIAPSYTQATHQHYPRINTQISIIQH